MNKSKNTLKGMAMGIAEVIPGVSGGTIAFITGIYPKLIHTIKSIDLNLLRNIRKRGWQGLKETIDLIFVGTLLLGMILGLLIGIFGVTFLYENYPEPLWGFFFGLIIASSVYIARTIGQCDWSTILIGIAGVIIAYFITVISPASGSESVFYILLSGILAISALILPGISGSFILLLLGMYTVIIPSVKSVITDQDINSLRIVFIFSIGCILGLMGFSRVLHYLFNSYEKKTLAVLTGFMIGSLNKIWPWRNAHQLIEKVTGTKSFVNDISDLEKINIEDFKILTENNVFPSDYFMSSPHVASTLLAIIAGFALVLVFSLMDKK